MVVFYSYRFNLHILPHTSGCHQGPRDRLSPYKCQNHRELLTRLRSRALVEYFFNSVCYITSFRNAEILRIQENHAFEFATVSITYKVRSSSFENEACAFWSYGVRHFSFDFSFCVPWSRHVSIRISEQKLPQNPGLTDKLWRSNRMVAFRNSVVCWENLIACFETPSFVLKIFWCIT